MALSGSTAKKYTPKGAYWTWVEWSGTQNIANNTTTITAITYAGTNGYGWYATNNNGSSVTINGATTSVGDSGDISKNTSKKELCRRTEVVSHNADGTKSVAISGRWWMSGTASFDLTSTGTFTLDTIPRASSISSFPNFNIGSGVTVGISRASTAFTHVVGLYLGGTHISTKYNVTTGVTFSAADVANLYNLTSSSSSATVTVYVETYNGTTKIGSTVSANATAVVESGIVPSLSSVSAAEDVAALVGVIPAGTYLQNYSKVKFTINGATAGAGASIASYKIVFNGVTYTSRISTTGTINATGNITATATVTDTRGRTSSAKTVSCNFLAFPASLNASNFTIGSGFTATLARPHANITNRFVLKYGTTTIKDTGKISANAYTFTAADLDAIYAHIPSAIVASVTLTATAYAGTTAINSRTSTLIASVGSDIKPVVTNMVLATAEQDTITADLGLGSTTFVQGKSRIKFTASGAAGMKSSSITGYSIAFLGANYANNATTEVINAVGTQSIVVTATDSRGRTTIKTYAVTFLGYTKPTITAFSVARNTTTNTNADLVLNGTIVSLNSKNQLTYTIKRKLRTDTSYSPLTGPTALAVGTATLAFTQAYTGNLTTNSYDYMVEVKDKYESISAVLSITTEAVPMSWSKTGVGIGKVWEQGALDVNGNIHHIGTLNTQTIAATGNVSGAAISGTTVTGTNVNATTLTIGGKKLTISTSAPASPATGDVWIDI